MAQKDNPNFGGQTTGGKDTPPAQPNGEIPHPAGAEPNRPSGLITRRAQELAKTHPLLQEVRRAKADQQQAEERNQQTATRERQKEIERQQREVTEKTRLEQLLTEGERILRDIHAEELIHEVRTTPAWSHYGEPNIRIIDYKDDGEAAVYLDKTDINGYEFVTGRYSFEGLPGAIIITPSELSYRPKTSIIISNPRFLPENLPVASFVTIQVLHHKSTGNFYIYIADGETEYRSQKNPPLNVQTALIPFTDAVQILAAVEIKLAEFTADRIRTHHTYLDVANDNNRRLEPAVKRYKAMLERDHEESSQSTRPDDHFNDFG